MLDFPPFPTIAARHPDSYPADVAVALLLAGLVILADRRCAKEAVVRQSLPSMIDCTATANAL